ncbi:MAG: M23 family metallopeptidase [Pseudomonadota bacterium]|nr:M23 family metallopeptidase [Pseudomonadota bacterium]
MINALRHNWASLFLSLFLVVTVMGGCSFMQPAHLPARSGIARGETITVEGNQNVYAVARQHNVSMRELIVLNRLKAPFILRKGQKLTLPADTLGGETSYISSSGPNDGSSMPPPVAAPTSTVIEQTSLPPIQVAPLPPVHSAPPVAVNARSSASGAPTSVTPVTALNTPTPAPKPVTTTVGSPAGSGSADMTFAWPVQGPVLSGFGPKAQGLTNDGINIAAPKGAPVVAAASGIVVYAGNEMKGFGTLVLIRHQGGWVTAYAHLDRALVNKDAVVARGDMIGTVGKTGNVPSPQLHFETRFNGKPVDPAGVIKD